MKSYKITTDDDHELKRAILADSMAWVLQEFDEKLRQVEKHGEEPAAEFAEYWRSELRSYCDDNGICIGELFQ